LAAAPFAAGIGISAAKTLADGVAAPRSSAIEDVMSAVRAANNSPARPSPADHLEFINGARNKGMFKGSGAEAARTAWIQAMQFSDPYSVSRLPALASRVNTLPADQIADAIEELARNSGHTTTNVFRRFRNNFNALSPSSSAFHYSTMTNMEISVPSYMKGVQIESNLQSMISKMAGGKGWRSEFFTRPGFYEEGLGMHKVKFGVGGRRLEFSLPISSGGIIAEGLTQSSVRIAPGVGIYDPVTKSLEQISREEFFLKKMEANIVARIHSGELKSQREVTKEINSLYQSVYSELESIPGISPKHKTEALKRYEQLRGAAIDIVSKTNLEKVSQQELADVMERYTVFSGTGAEGLGRSRVQTVNIAEEYKLFPSAVDWSRNPQQAFREYQLTEESLKELSKGRWAAYRDYETAMAEASSLQGPHLKAMYVNPEMHAEMLEKLKIGEGEAMARRGLSSLVSHEFVRSAHIKVGQGQTTEEFMSKVAGGGFKPGEVIGWDKTGKAITMKKGMRLLEAVPNITTSSGEFATLHYMDVRKMKSSEKWFGDFKALMRLVNDQWFSSRARRLTKNTEMLRNLDAFVTMDELKKDPSKFAKQVLTSIGETMRARGAAFSARDVAKQLESAAMVGGAFDPTSFTRAAMGLAATQKFRAAEFGAAFGAAPYVLGEEAATGLATEVLGAKAGTAQAYIKAMSQGVASGIAQIAYGGPEELRGAGKLGSLEPRAFQILQGPAFQGPLGGMLQEEFTTRMIEGDPEKLRTHQALTKTLASMAGKVKPGQGASIFDIGKEFADPEYARRFKSFIESGGGWIRPGKGISDIFVPGADIISTMRPFKTASGQETLGALAPAYHQLAGIYGEMYQDIAPISAYDARKAAAEATAELHRHQAAAGKGIGAYLRGKVPGSRFFTGVSTVGGYKPSGHLFEVGVSAAYAEKMFAEMEELGYKMGDIRHRFARGEAIGGVFGRHPFIDDYSLQQILIRKARSKAAQIAVPEINVGVSFKGVSGEQTLALGPLVGLGGDKDADLYSAMLVSEKPEKIIRKNLMEADSEYIKRYTQHQVRYQMLKAGKPEAAALPTIQSMIGQSRKLAVVPEYVGRLSTQFAAAKSAIRRFGPGGAAGAEAEQLLTWLEQTPLSSKHASAQEAFAGRIGQQMDLLGASFRDVSREGLADVVEQVTRGNKVSEQLLKGDVRLDPASIERINKAMGGNYVSGTLRGTNVPRAINTIMSSLEEYTSSGAARAEQLLSARGRGIKESEIAEHVASSRAFREAGSKTFSKVSAAATAASNYMGAAGRKMMKNARPAGLGFAAMLGIGAVLSTPDELVGSGSGMIPKGGINMRPGKAANRMNPEQIHAGSRPVGRPSAPDMLRQRSAMVSGKGVSRNTHVRAFAGSTMDVGGMAGEIGLAAENRSVNINIQDRRDSLNPHVIANKMF
jgi:hypothetical protein